MRRMAKSAPVPSIPASWYVDADRVEVERERVLRDAWYYLGDADGLAAPGSYTTATVAGAPVVVTCDEDGVLRAFANVCAHRGAVIARGSGKRRTLQCPYHGWTYRLDGLLHRAPRMTTGCDSIRLRQLTLEQVGSLMFVAVGARVEPVGELLGPWLDTVRQVAGIDITALSRRARVEHRIGANWKAVVENFLECYHCPLVHASTLPGFGGGDYRVEIHGPLQVQRLDRERFAFGFLFPVTQISAYGRDRVVVARSLSPDGPAATEATLDYWFPASASQREVTEWVTWFESVVAEDIPLCESVQIGLSSGLLDAGLLDPVNESGPLHFQRLLMEHLGDD
jgi:choline monooxygenase